MFSLKENQENLHENVKEYFEGLDFDKPVAAVDRRIRVNTVSTHDKG